jgi:hypothetical protein
MNRHSLRVIPDQPLGHAAWFAGRLTLDMNKESGIHKLRRLLCRQESDPSPNLRTGTDCRRKTDPIQAVVDAHRDARADMDCLTHPVTQQRKSQKTMGDSPAEGRFTLGALRVKVNPLAVLGDIGKSLNTILRDREPLGRGKFSSLQLLQRTQCLNLERRHRSFS